MADPKSVPERITELTALAKGAWTSLLTAILFIGVTLVSLRHAEFLVAGENVTLPVISLSMPTRMFFFCAPVLLAVLYVNLHNHLRRLWKAFEIAPPDREGSPEFGTKPYRLADDIPTWMGNDLALSMNAGNTPHAEEWAGGRDLIASFLIWWLAPAVLVYAWYRFLPARDPLLTLVILACLAAMVVMGSRSRTEAMVRLRKRDRAALERRAALGGGAILALLLVASGAWIFGPAGLRPYEARFAAARDILAQIGSGSPEGRRRVAALAGLTLDIDRGKIVKADAIPSAADSREAFRKGWCERMEIETEVCGNVPGATIGATNTTTLRRRAYCQRAEIRALYLRPADCEQYFDLIDARFEVDWIAARRAELGKLPVIDLTARDLTGASAEGAQLSRVDLTHASLSGANLPWARFEGATLQEADLTDLWAYYADFSLANFTDADMRHANLEWSDLADAVLIRADLRGANLSGANLVGADLRGADLRGAKLIRAKLYRARLEGALLFDADLTDADGLTQAQLDGAAGEARPPAPDTEAGAACAGGTCLPRPREIGLLPNRLQPPLEIRSCFARRPEVIERMCDDWEDATTKETCRAWASPRTAEWEARLCPRPDGPAIAATGLTTRPDTRRVDPYPLPPFRTLAPARFGD
ncbi:pentapeptide repeat-containing protein [Amaricoccus solimangrovi]|uniref:Pentapeptide repeat-containing protein n=1 Tax=Amaricoccus solimangrovi TaxID=2589815 RepID=A0A501WP24_9RHOB|nr:pentapeptide repeat-containing protein [Amaricoccus solimangrovi]TPE51493.1 pentapeptide repeat-containing protein [Amaricoccus solimangrovi]